MIAGMRRWLLRLAAALRSGRAEQELAREVTAHLALIEDEYRQRGMSPEDARFAARRAMGGAEQAKELHRDARSFAWIEDLQRDVRYAARVLTRNRGFTAVAALTLSLGIGANTAIFSLIDALLLRPLPVRDPAGLMQIVAVGNDSPNGESNEYFSYPVVRALAEQRDTFASLGAFSSFRFDAGIGDDVRKTWGALVTGDYYAALGVHAAAGRLLSAADDEPAAAPVAVIGDGYWRRVFARDPSAIGRALRINGRPVTIVGVSGAGFTGAQVGVNAEITVPVSTIPYLYPELKSLLGTGNFWLRMLARPRDGLSPTQATARLAADWPRLAPGLAPAAPPQARDGLLKSSLIVRSGATGSSPLRGTYAKPLYVLMVLVGIVMLIACANLAGLLLARAGTRQREIALRFAIGAARGRMIRQLLTESALLSLAGAAIGSAFAWLFSRALVNLISTGPQPIALDLNPHWHVLAFTTVLALMATLIFGLAPAWQATAGVPAAAMKNEPRRSRGWMLPAVVTAQVGLCLLLLVGAGLFGQTLRNLRGVELGFDTENVLVVDAARRPATFYSDALDSVRRVPGVLSASLSTNYPLSGSGWSEPVEIDGRKLERQQTFFGISPDYFQTLGTGLLRGREFTSADLSGPPTVAIVNDAFVRRHLGGGNPLGRRLSTPDWRDLEVIGVVSDAVTNDLRRSPPPIVYLSWFQVDTPARIFTTLQVRAAGPLPLVSEAIRSELQPRTGGATVEVRTLAAQVAGASITERLMTMLAAGLSAVALVLALVGLYGVLGYSAAARSKEIGIRLALGARRTEVVAMVMRQGVYVALVGIAAGIASAAALSRYLEEMLFGLTPLDPSTFATVAVGFTAVAMLASLVPAVRAANSEPVSALRLE